MPALVGYYEPWWVQVLKALVIFVIALQLVPVVLIAERKLLGRFQSRYGPNRVGPFGLLQPLADILKLLTKEQFRPRTSVGFLFAVAPILSLTGIVHAQAGMWYVVPQFVGFLIFLIAGFAETNRAPFDLTEADAELVGGYNTEFGGGRFASYYFAEYLNVLVVSGITTTVFLGGWLLPFGLHPPGWVDPLVVLAKMSLVTFLFIWIRATLPRLRYDQLMSFGWKALLPLATLNALVTAIVVVATH